MRSATIDPMFTVPIGYELQLSPCVSDGVPEPAAWATMLFGFFGIGGMIRRAGPADPGGLDRAESGGATCDLACW